MALVRPASALPTEEPVLFSDGGGADSILDEVVIDSHLGVLGVDEQFIPEVEGVGDGFSSLTFGQVRRLLGLKLEPDTLKDGNTFFLANGAAVFLWGRSQAGLDFIEPLDFEQRLSGERTFVAGLVKFAYASLRSPCTLRKLIRGGDD